MNRLCGGPHSKRKEMFEADKYQEFDSKIFDITKIMLDFSLTEGQKSELRTVMEEMETAHREGLLTDAQHGKLLCIMADCGMELPLVAVDQAELEKRLAAYTQSDDFQMDLADLAHDYQCQGLPVPPTEQLREEAAGEARKCLESMMACEAKGHLWRERADPENGTSELACRRCGATENLRW